MRAYRLIGMRLLLFVVVLASSASCWSQDKTAKAKDFADSVLSMFDRGQYSEMYDGFDPGARTLTREQWVKTAGELANQRGKVVTRALANKVHSMGVYRFLYNSQCTNGKVFEDVGVSDNSGSWKIVVFIVKPNLE